MKNLAIVNTDFNTEFGFFWVEFENGKSLQCCLVCEDGNFVEKIESDDCGSSEGLSFDNNEWALSDDCSFKEINEFLFEQAESIGIEVI